MEKSTYRNTLSITGSRPLDLSKRHNDVSAERSRSALWWLAFNTAIPLMPGSIELYEERNRQRGSNTVQKARPKRVFVLALGRREIRGAEAGTKARTASASDCGTTCFRGHAKLAICGQVFFDGYHYSVSLFQPDLGESRLVLIRAACRLGG